MNKKMVPRLLALGVIGFAVYRGLKMLGVIGDKESADFEWSDDTN